MCFEMGENEVTRKILHTVLKYSESGFGTVSRISTGCVS